MAETNGNAITWQNMAIWLLAAFTAMGGLIYRDTAAKLQDVAGKLEKLEEKQGTQNVAIAILQRDNETRSQLAGVTASLAEIVEQLRREREPARVTPQGSFRGLSKFDK